MKCCGNCDKKLGCFYRGILNPCDDWTPDASIKLLQIKAKKCIGKPMDFEEARFIETCATAVTFSPRQNEWLSNIANRVLS